LTVSAKLHIDQIGHERHPIIIIDDFAEDFEAMRAEAGSLSYGPGGKHYPGVRAAIPEVRVTRFMARVHDLVMQTFGGSGDVRLIEAVYSLVTTPSIDLTPIQRIPHFDGFEPERIALLFYMSETDQGGTAFYRHRSTGFETISRARHADYDAALHRDVAQHGLPAPSYISGSTAIYEQIARYDAKPNRALLYRGNVLHCADLTTDVAFSADPKIGRLTANIFLWGSL